MRIGYSYWGFLGDRKYDDKGNILSTPDGNAFYSWSIINKFIEDGHQVIGIMPDRDEPGFRFEGVNLFSSWCKTSRSNAYMSMNHIEYGDFFDIDNRDILSEDAIKVLWDMYHVNEFDVIIHEWRMPIIGRNTSVDKDSENWQPDLFIQDALIRYCIKNNIKLIIFDLDYKIPMDLVEYFVYETKNIYVFELGTKWSSIAYETDGRCRKVYIPFDFRFMNLFKLKSKFTDDIVYIGNRYERDWCIDKYLKDVPGVKVFGNWLEGQRHSEKEWPTINFGKRLQTSDMHDAYSNSATTILLAKREYCENGFMTARILEAIFYGCVPLFIEEYGEDVISLYAGCFADELTVRNAEDVINKIKRFKEDVSFRNKVIDYLRVYLTFMDVSCFTRNVYNVINDGV